MQLYQKWMTWFWRRGVLPTCNNIRFGRTVEEMDSGIWIAHVTRSIYYILLVRSNQQQSFTCHPNWITIWRRRRSFTEKKEASEETTQRDPSIRRSEFRLNRQATMRRWCIWLRFRILMASSHLFPCNLSCLNGTASSSSVLSLNLRDAVSAKTVVVQSSSIRNGSLVFKVWFSSSRFLRFVQIVSEWASERARVSQWMVWSV